jgi:hypothetical protein
MYYKDQYLEELYKIYHRHDDDKKYVEYEDVILSKALSAKIYENDRMFNYLDRLKKLVAMLFDNHNIIKNFKNYNVDKYYYKHKN